MRCSPRRASVLAAVLTAACGGGGGPPSGATPPPPPPTGPSITLTLENLPTRPLEVGERWRFGVQARDSTGAPILALRYQWTSSNPAVATVEFGELLAIAAGQTTISASGGGASSPGHLVEVVAATPLAIALSPDSLIIRPGDVGTLTAEVTGERGVIANPEVQWTSANPTIATVDAGGRVTGVAVGVTTVAATAGSQTASVRVVIAERFVNLEIPIVQLIQSAQAIDGSIPTVVGKPTAVRLYPEANLSGLSHAVIRVEAIGAGGPVFTTEILTGEIPQAADPADPFQGLIAPLPVGLDLATVAIRATIDPYDEFPEVDETDNVAPTEPAGMVPALVMIPPLRVRLIPLAPQRTPPAVPREMTLQEAEAMLAFAEVLFPVPGLEVSLGESAVTPTDWSDPGPVLSYIESRRIADGFDGLYVGVMPPGFTIGPNNNSGFGYIGGNAAISSPNPKTMAHEIGHNLSLPHPPGCGIDGPGDVRYPYPFGTIGIPGWNAVTGMIQSAFKYDIMSYCGSSSIDDHWISDYNYAKVVTYLDMMPPPSTLRADESGSMRVRLAGVARDGVLVLEPLALLAPAGGVSIDGGNVVVRFLSAGGAELAQWRLRSFLLSDDPEGAAFVGIIPVDPDLWAQIALVRVTAEGISATAAP